jgi:phage-related minor tail protein
VSKHSRSILEMAARQQWGDIKQELVRTQAEVETAMMGLKDEEIAHLVA